MAKPSIPVYDNCTISTSNNPSQEILVERFADYLSKHYQHLHTPHRHTFYHLVLFTRGKGSHTIDFVKFPVTAFQAYFMAPGQVHSWDFTGADGYIINFSENFFKNFLLNTNYLEQFWFFSGHSDDSIRQFPADIHKEVIGLFEALLKEANGVFKSPNDMVRVLLLQLLITIDRFSTGSSKTRVAPPKQQLFRSFQRLIGSYYKTLKLPKEFADLLYITPGHLNALCREVTGKTAGELIRERVLLEAKRLLTNADMNITEIAYELNFSDNSYFNRFFKKNEGITPEEFRKKISHP